MKKILIIEDEDVAYWFTERLLEILGYTTDRIVRCTELRELAGIDPEEIEMVLTDLTLPDSVYPATFEHVKDKFPYTPIIVLTGTAEIEVAISTIQQGAQDYLVKGDFNQRSLAKAIQYAFERKKIINDYKRLFNDSPSPMYIIDNDNYKILAANTAALILYGYTWEEFSKMSAEEIRPIEDLEAFYRVCKSMSDNFFDAGQWRHVKKNGEIFYVHIYTHNTQFEGREARVVNAINIDNEVKAEKALHEKVEEMNTVLESIADGFFTLDNEWKIVRVNKESEKRFGKNRKDLIGRHIREIVPEIKEMKLYSECKRAIEEKTSVHFEEYFAGYDVWLMINGYPTKEGLAVYFTDITEQKKAIEKIFIEKQNLHATINNTKDIIWSVSRDFEIFSGNKAFWERVYLLSGKRKNEVQSHDFEKGLFDTWINYYKRALTGEGYKIIWTEANIGKTVYEEVSFNPIFDKGRNVIGVSCFSRDITEQKMHMDMIEKQNEQLRKIAWTQSHEVRSPLATIMGLVELFNHDNSNNVEILNHIKEAADLLDSVIKKITSYTYTPPS